MVNKAKARKTALFGVVLLWAFLSDALANQLQDVSFSALPGNRVEIVLTTTLANYANSLKDNEAAMQWINLTEPDPIGITGEVRLLKRITR